MSVMTPSDDADDTFHSICSDSKSISNDGTTDSIMEPPVHPVAAMQGAFEESIIEATEEDDENRPKAPSQRTPQQRRAAILDAPSYDNSWLARWNQREDMKYHPLLKLMAQIVFGMHLLEQGQAKSVEEVVRILQNHVNDVDAFLERSCEDFDLAIQDIEERVRFLKLPMDHMGTFEPMLENKKFRTELLEGNEKIERIVRRTGRMQKATLADLAVCTDSVRELGRYLNAVEATWPSSGRESAETFAAMRGNEQGWLRFIQDLQTKGSNLGHNLHVLTALTEEIARLAAAASRRTRPQSTFSSRPISVATASTSLRSKFARMPVEPTVLMEKPLPREPESRLDGVRATIPKMHPMPFETRYEQPRARPPTPPNKTMRDSSNSPKHMSSVHDSPQSLHRPANNIPRSARIDAQNDTRDLAEFLKSSGPASLQSSSPDGSRQRGRDVQSERAMEKRPARSRSLGAKEMLATFSSRRHSASAQRSLSQGPNLLPGFADKKRNASTISLAIFNRSSKEPTERLSKTSSQRAMSFFRRDSSKNAPTLQRPSTTATTSTNTSEPISRPVDSARSSAADKHSLFRPSSLIQSPNKLRRPRTEPHPSNPHTSAQRPSQLYACGPPVPTRLSMFPRTIRPVTPSQEFRSSASSSSAESSIARPYTANSFQNGADLRRTQTMPVSAELDAQQQQPRLPARSTATPSHLRTGSLRKLFHRRPDSVALVQ